MYCGNTFVGLNPFIVGGFSGLCAFMGVAATFVSAYLVKRLGILKVCFSFLSGAYVLCCMPLSLTLTLLLKVWNFFLIGRCSRLDIPSFTSHSCCRCVLEWNTISESAEPSSLIPLFNRKYIVFFSFKC